jgi:hypothetical protein
VQIVEVDRAVVRRSTTCSQSTLEHPCTEREHNMRSYPCLSKANEAVHQTDFFISTDHVQIVLQIEPCIVLQASGEALAEQKQMRVHAAVMYVVIS